MGIRLIVEFMDHGPPLTPMEWKAMVVLLEDANDKTRLTWSQVTDPHIERRIGLSGRAWTNLRGSLVRKGALIVAVRAKRGQVAKYRIPIFNPNPMGHEIDDPMRQIGHEIDDLTSGIGHETDDPKGQWVMRSVTPTPPGPSTFPSPQTPAVADPSAAPGGGGGGEQQRDEHGRAAVLVDALDYRGRPPGRRRRDELTALIASALNAGWTEHALKEYLDLGQAPVGFPAAVYLHRLGPDELPDPPATRPAATAAPKCGECDADGFRYRDPVAELDPYRCPCRTPQQANTQGDIA